MTNVGVIVPSINAAKSNGNQEAKALLANCQLPSTANDVGTRRQWTLKGIPPEAVDETREAARRSGMKLNSWVTQALLRAIDESKDEEPGDVSTPEFQEDRNAELERYIKESLSDLRRRTEEIESSMKTINAFLVKMYSER